MQNAASTALKADAKPAPAGIDRAELEHATPHAVRMAIRSGRWRGNTKRLALGYYQANVIIVQERYAFDFMRFCMRNPKPFPLMDVTDAGDPVSRRLAPDADLRTDVGDYSVFRDGKLIECVPDLTKHWRSDHVAFLTGCGMSLGRVMEEARILIPEDVSPKYITGVRCTAVGFFHGPVVMTMRVVPDDLVLRITELTSRYALCHGGPTHLGDPAAIGIKDLNQPNWGKPLQVPAGHTAMFNACGLTSHAVAMACGLPEMIMQTVGRMLITDIPVTESYSTNF